MHGQYGVRHVMHEAPEFAGHAEQTAAPVAFEYFATPQFVHAELLVAADVPASHISHVDAPGAPENVPATQAVHAAVPVATLYVPARHCVHRPPFAPEEPALQVHAASAELAIGELELAGHARQVASTVAATAVEYFATAQSRHTVVPVAILYFPATHAVHVPPFGPVKPRLQTQAVRITLVAGELEPSGHVKHVLAPAVEYVPAPQFTHEVVPVPLVNFPATHVVHAPPLTPDEPALQVQAISAVL